MPIIPHNSIVREAGRNHFPMGRVMTGEQVELHIATKSLYQLLGDGIY
jgi:hypothetical protein